MQLRSLEADLESSTADLNHAQSQLISKSSLITRLEEDILHLQSKEITPNDTLASLIIPQNGAAVDSHGIIQILTSQRDRYRQKNAELEEQLRIVNNSLQNVQSELNKTKSDNVALYEKIRYLSSYGKDVVLPMKNEEKYKSIYEERLDPFTKFSRRVRGVLLVVLCTQKFNLYLGGIPPH